MVFVNLHAIANPLIAQLHPNVEALLYRSTGQANILGKLLPAYAEGERLTVQFQSEGPTILAHADKSGQENVTRKLYLFSDSSMTKRVSGIVRPLSRGGDMLHLAEGGGWYAGTWWLVEGPVEDFSGSGWQCVRASMQNQAPDFSGSEWYLP